MKNFRFHIKCAVCVVMAALILMLPCSLYTSAMPIFDVKFSRAIAYSDDDWWGRGVQYGRVLVLKHSTQGQNNVLLATHSAMTAGLEDYNPRYPIYRSVDQGKTWECITHVTDTMSGVNSEWNPHLFELEKPCGDYPAGTIVLAACSIDAGHKVRSHIRLYFSRDGGMTFDQGVIVATAGGLEEGVWEPFLLQLDDGRLVCYYSDDSDPEHSQKIVYKVSSDCVNWGEVVDVVATDIFKERPGMPVVTRLGDGSYFMVYEVVDKNGVSGNPVCCRTSKDALDWGDPKDIGEEIVNYDGSMALGSAPYCAWTPVGSENGTLIVSGTFMRKGYSSTGTDYFLSTDNGKSWMTIPHVIPYTVADHVGYSNAFTFSSDGKIMYAINNPQDPRNPEKSKIVFAAVELEENAYNSDENKATDLPPQSEDNGLTSSPQKDDSPQTNDTQPDVSEAPTNEDDVMTEDGGETKTNPLLIVLIGVIGFTVVASAAIGTAIIYFKKKK